MALMMSNVCRTLQSHDKSSAILVAGGGEHAASRGGKCAGMTTVGTTSK